MKNSFLQDIRVLALTWVWAGPWTGAVLADMGAEVIKVESNERPDGLRMEKMGWPQEESKSLMNRSAFNVINRGVKSCTINLKKTKGLEILRDLVKISDVVISNFSSRVLPSLGMSYDTLKEIKPDIIMVSLQGFGSTGPDKDYVAYASTVEAVGGLNASFGYPDSEPAIGALNPGDPIGSMYAVFSTLNALYFRNKTGKGQYVDISESECVTTLLPEVIMEYVMNDRIRPCMGNRHEIMAPHNCYRCKGDDKWVAIAVSTEQEWMALCQVMGNPEWSQDVKFLDQLSRWQHQDELDRLVTEWTKDRTPYEVMHMLQKVGVAAGPSFNVEELIHDPHINERGAIIEQIHPEAGKTFAYRPPWTSALTKENPPAPRLGEHNNYVFKELLGMSDMEFNHLVDEKVIY